MNNRQASLTRFLFLFGGALARRLLRWSIVISLLVVVSVRADFPPVQIDYFFEIGCPTCAAVEADVLPLLEETYDGLYELHRLDIGVLTNYLLLVACQERLGMSEDAPVSIVVDRKSAK